MTEFLIYVACGVVGFVAVLALTGVASAMIEEANGGPPIRTSFPPAPHTTAVVAVLALFMTLGCSGHSAPRPPAKPPVVVPTTQPAQTIIGRRPLAGEVLRPGRTNVYAGDILLGYLVYDADLYYEPHAPGDTGVTAVNGTDAGGTRYWRAIGDLPWCVAAAFGDGAPWTVLTPTP